MNIHCNQWLEVLDELNIGAMTVDLGHRITGINHCAQSLIGLRIHEVLNCDCREVFTGVPCMVTCVLEGERESGYADSTVQFRDEENREYTMTRIATPIYDQGQKIAGCLTILQDHSPISDLIDRLRHEERSLKNILDSLDVGVFTFNRGGLLTFFNTTAERISGYSRDEVLGKSYGTIFENKALEEKGPPEKAVSRKEVRRFHFGNLIDKYGGSIPIRANYTALKNEKETTIGGLATFQDMTILNQVNQTIHRRFTYKDMIGKSPLMQRLFDMIPMVSASDAAVLIEGPTGTGKDLLAKIIHSESSRKDHPFVKINCAAVPESLLESEFFGYVKGAFTGAQRDKPGRFETANDGTVFLDEIGDLPLSLQAKLLRVLEDKEFYPLGGLKTRTVNVRIISATNRNLEQLLKRNQFREDLYYRLNVVRLELPALCRRREDLPLLIRFVLRKVSAMRAMPPPIISQDAMQILLNYIYPGNVREMENIIEHAMILCRQSSIEACHLPDYLRSENLFALKKGSEEKDPLPDEIKTIETALGKYNGNRCRTARALGINRTTLWRKMKRYGLLDR